MKTFLLGLIALGSITAHASGVIGGVCIAEYQEIVESPPGKFEVIKELRLSPTLQIGTTQWGDVSARYKWTLNGKTYSAYTEYNNSGDYGIAFISVTQLDGQKITSRARIHPNTEAEIYDSHEFGNMTKRVWVFCNKGEIK